jgi:hypothetical protein
MLPERMKFCNVCSITHGTHDHDTIDCTELPWHKRVEFRGLIIENNIRLRRYTMDGLLGNRLHSIVRTTHIKRVNQRNEFFDTLEGDLVRMKEIFKTKRNLVNFPDEVV